MTGLTHLPSGREARPQTHASDAAKGARHFQAISTYGSDIPGASAHVNSFTVWGRVMAAPF